MTQERAPSERTIYIGSCSRTLKQYFQRIGRLLYCRTSLAQPTHTASPAWHFVLLCAGAFLSCDVSAESSQGGKSSCKANFAHFPAEKPSGCTSPKSKQNSHMLAIKTCRVLAGRSTTACLSCTPHSPWSGRWLVSVTSNPCKPGGDALCHLIPSGGAKCPWVKCPASRRASSVLQDRAQACVCPAQRRVRSLSRGLFWGLWKQLPKLPKIF